MQELNIHRLQTQVDIDTEERSYHLPIASATTLGGIKVGNNLSITPDGTLSASDITYTLPTASATILGGIKVGSNLQITDGVLTAKVDSVLSSTSTYPVQNSTINSTVSTINSDITSLGSRVGVLETSNADIINSISGIEGSITSLDDATDTLSSDLSDLSSTVSGFSSDITQNTNDISALGTRMTAVEGVAAANALDIVALKSLTDDEFTYSYLLPVSTWTAGSIVLEKRGKVGTLYIDIEGDLTIASGNSSIIYTFSDLGLYTPAFATLMSDDGVFVGKVDDETSNLTFENITSQSIHINKVKGSIPLIFN